MVVDLKIVFKGLRATALALLLSAAAVLTVAPAHRIASAQTNISGDIAGTVTDPSGAAIPNASVTIKSARTGQTQTATSGGNGSYRAAALRPGTYTVTVAAAGFQTSTLQVTVSAGVVSAGDVKLTVGQGTTTVEVTEAEPLLHTESADLATTFSMQQVQSLPNPGNDLTFIAQTAPGAVMNTQGGYGNFAIFGLPATSNTFTVNGGYENDPFLNLGNSGATNLLLGNNDVGQVTVVSNAYGAQYGGLGGTQVNEISRAGGNAFHGDATYWWNGSVMNANDYFNNQTAIKKPRSNANQWAGAFGGPILKDKTFFFFNTEGLRVIIPVRGTVYAPSQNFIATTNAGLSPSDLPFYNKLFAVYTKNPNYATAGSIPKTTDVSPTLINGVPSPTLTTPNVVTYSANASNFAHEWLISGRVDQKLTDKDNMFVHFKIDKGVQPTFTSLLDPLFDTNSPQPSYEGQLNETHIFTPNIANQFVFAAIYYRAIFTNTNAAAANAISPFSLFFLSGDMANNGAATSLGGIDFFFPQGRNVTGYQFVDDFSVTRGNHNYKAGFALRRDDVTDYGPSVLTTPEVLANETPALVDPTNPAKGYQPSFQAGTANLYVQQFPNRLSQPVAVYTLGWYAQDEWKLRPNFTLTYGMRFEHNSNPTCITNCYAGLASDFGSLPTSTGTPLNKLIQSGLHNAFKNFQKVGYEPRIGFAWSPFGTGTKTVVRGGFGMFADSFPAQIADSLLNNAPLNVQIVTGGGSLNPADAGSNAIAAGQASAALKAGFAGGGTSASLGVQPSFVNAASKISYPTYEEYSLELQQQLDRSTTIQLDYVGNHGYHEPVNANSVNAFNGGLPAGTFPELGAAPPNQNFGPVTQVYSGASSNYNGFIVDVTRRTKSLLLQANYVYSHALDEISNGGFNGFSGNSINPTNPFNLASNYGNADYDTRHYINGSYVYTLPYYGGPHIVTDGWEVAGTVFHSNGLPFSVNDVGTGSSIGNYNGGNGGGLLLAQQLTPHISTSCNGGSHVFNNNPSGPAGKPCAIATEFGPATDFGQQARNQIFGPHYTDFDFTITKAFAIPKTETANFKMGLQFFNIFNHPNFAQPSHDIVSPTLGLTSGTVNPPTSILGSFLGGDASPRLIQLKANFTF